MTPDLTCAACEDALLPYLTGELALAERHAVERHLAGCAACQGRLDEWRLVADATASALRAADASAPRDADMAQGWAALRARLPLSTQLSASSAATSSPGPAPDSRRIPRSIQTIHEPSDNESLREEFTGMEHNPSHATPSQLARRVSLAQATRNGRPGVLAAGNATRPYDRPGGRSAALAIGALAAIVVLSLVVFNVYGARLRGATSRHAVATQPTCQPSQYAAKLPRGGSVLSVAPVGATNGWAVGDVRDTAASAPRTLMMQLRDCVWTPSGDSIPNAELTTVAMTAPNEGWAIGATQQPFVVSGQPTQYVSDQVFALHDSGGVWRRVKLPGNLAVGDLTTLHMLTAHDGWLLIGNGKHTQVVNGQAVSSFGYSLLHYDGVAWTAVPLTFDQPSMILSDMTALPDGDVWIVGYETGVGAPGAPSAVIAHYVNGQWSQATDAALGDGSGYPTLYGVSFASPQEGYAVGSYGYHDANGDHTGALILRYAGSTWTKVALPVVPNQTDATLMQVMAIGPGAAWTFGSQQINCAQPSCMSQVSPGGTAFALQLSGGQWQVVTWPITTLRGGYHFADVGGLTMFSSTRGWAVEGGYAFVGNAAQSENIGHILLYNNGSWRELPGQQ